MPRRKVTFEYDPSNREGKPLERIIAGWSGVDALNIVIEDLPDPPVHQRFLAVYDGMPGAPRLPASAVHSRLREDVYRDGAWTITEVTDAFDEED